MASFKCTRLSGWTYKVTLSAPGLTVPHGTIAVKDTTYPVLRRLPNKSTLVPTRTRVTLHRVPTGPDEVVKLRELDDEPVPVVLVEWSLLKVVLHEGGL